MGKACQTHILHNKIIIVVIIVAFTIINFAGPSMQRKSCPITRASGFCYWATEWFLFLTCPMGKYCFLGKFKSQKDCNQACKSRRVLGLVEMTCGLVNASYSLPEWQAVKLTFFTPWGPLVLISMRKFWLVIKEVVNECHYISVLLLASLVLGLQWKV